MRHFRVIVDFDSVKVIYFFKVDILAEMFLAFNYTELFLLLFLLDLRSRERNILYGLIKNI